MGKGLRGVHPQHTCMHCFGGDAHRGNIFELGGWGAGLKTIYCDGGYRPPHPWEGSEHPTPGEGAHPHRKHFKDLQGEGL